MTARSMAGLCAALALIAIAGCGGDDEGRVNVQGGTGTATSATSTTGTSTESRTGPAGKAVATIKVSETEFALSPANPEVSKTGVVSFKVSNKGSIKHALEVEGPGGEVATASIAPGKSATLRTNLSKPGRYVWYCPIANHKSRGMRGQITVGGGAGKASAEEKRAGSDGHGGY